MSMAAAWLVSAVLVEAAVIDGRALRVPNWLTVHLVLVGLAVSAWSGGWSGLGWSLAGAATGLAVLMPLYAIGGMGAGDVKLMAGIGAWTGPLIALYAFVATALVGGAIALAMMAASGAWAQHWATCRLIGREVVTVRDPVLLAESAAARKPSMMLLPYGIPMAIGTIGYFAWAGLLY
jgi:prepilin peptidase CpaA